MNMQHKLASALFGVSLLIGGIFGIQSPKLFGDGTGTISQLSPWSTTASTTRLASTTAQLRIPSLISCDTIDTDSAGYLFCGTDTGGAGSQTPWTSNINGGAYSLSNVGSLDATSSVITQATSTNFAILGVTSALLKTNAGGSVVPAVLGTDYQNYTWPFPSNATTSILNFSNGLIAGTSSFIGATTTFTGDMLLDSHTNALYVHNLQAHSSAGTFFRNTSGANILNLGAGGGQASSFYDGVSVTGVMAANGGLTFTQATGTGLYVSASSTFQDLQVPHTASSTLKNLNDFFTLYSVGKFSGGVVTDIGGGAISVSAGAGTIATGNLPTSPLVFSDWAASSSIAIPTNTVRWIGIDYNSGTPIVVVKTSDTFTYQDNFPLGTVANESGTLHISSNPRSSADASGQLIRRFHQTLPVKRDELAGGLILSSVGTRNVAVSAGYLWERNNRFTISAINTSTGGTFDTYLGATKYQSGATQWDNESYNNGGTLASTTANRWGNIWFFLELDGGLVALYGTVNATSLASAQTEGAPTTLPLRCTEACTLIGRVTFQEGASSGTFQSAFVTTFSLSGASDHASLSNLTWSTAGHTFDTNLNLGAYNLQTTGTVTATSSDFTNLTVTSLTSALMLTNGSGVFAEYAGSTCTNQAVTAISALGAATCTTLTSAYVSGLDISDDTNLTATWPIVLTGDTLSWGGLSTSTTPTAGHIAFWNSSSLLSSVATGTISANYPASVSATRYAIGGDVAISVATSSSFTVPLSSTTTMGSGTTTISIGSYLGGATFSAMGCNGRGGGTFTTVIGDGSASSTYVVSATGLTTTFTTLSSNNTFTSGELIFVAFGSVSGTVGYPSCSFLRN